MVLGDTSDRVFSVSLNTIEDLKAAIQTSHRLNTLLQADSKHRSILLRDNASKRRASHVAATPMMRLDSMSIMGSAHGPPPEYSTESYPANQIGG